MMFCTKRLGGHLSAILLALLICLLAALPAFAQSPSAFSVRAQLPENQMDAGNTYFDLLVEPGQVQLIQVAVTNSESREILAHLALNPASTSQNGLIVYSDPDARDESLALSISDIALVEESTVRIPPGETRLVDIRLELPQEPFRGTVLGGISVTAEFDDAEELEGEAGQGFQIENRYAYVIGLKLRQDEEPVEPAFQLAAIQPGLVNYRQALLVNLRQSEPVIAGELTVAATVTRRDDPDFAKGLQLTGAQMAPSSLGEFVVDWSEPMEPGTYRLQLRVDWRERFWEWDEEFVIAGDQAQSFNQQSVIRPEQTGVPVWALVLLALVVGLLLCILLLLLLLLRKKRGEDQNGQPQ